MFPKTIPILLIKAIVEAAESSVISAKTEETKRSLLSDMNHAELHHYEPCDPCTLNYNATKAVMDGIGYTDYSSKYECNWEGVTCDRSGSTIGISVWYRGFQSGTIATEIGFLTSMVDISLFGNELVGTLPSELGLLSNMRSFFLNDNKISGTIPSELGLLSNMRSFYLVYNKISGTIPSELGLLSNMRDFSLGDNKISGTIPSELGLLSNLEYIDFAKNKLTGTVPSELGLCEELYFLDLRNNDLTGTFPSSFCSLDYIWVTLHHDLDSSLIDTLTCPRLIVLKPLLIVSGLLSFVA